MASEIQSLQGLLDIESPLAPVPADDWYLIGVVASIAVLVALRGWHVWHRDRRRHALRTLAKLRADYRTQRLDRVGTAFALAHILHDGLDLRGLAPTTPLPPCLQTERLRWDDFVSALRHARYGRDTDGSNTAIEPLIDEAMFWLRRWR